MSIQLVQNRFSEAERRMSEVMEKHEQYLVTAYPNDETVNAEDNEWFQQICDDYDDMETKVEERSKTAIQLAKDVTSSEKTGNTNQQVARACEYDEMLLIASIESLKITLTDDEVTVETIKAAQEDMKERVNSYRETQRGFVLTTTEDLAKEAMDRMKQLISNYTSVNLAAGKLIGQRTKLAQPVRKDANESMLNWRE